MIFNGCESNTPVGPEENITTGSDGSATVELPAYFQALNINYRYQLTTIGQQAQAWIESKIQNNQFTIKTDKPNVEVSPVFVMIRMLKPIQ